MPKSAKKSFTIKKFNIGAVYTGKLQPKQVKGGVVLKNTDFTIKGLTKKTNNDIMVELNPQTARQAVVLAEVLGRPKGYPRFRH